jgi:hypothetical protein
MSTTLTPPPPAPQAPAPTGPSGPSRAVAIVAMVLGAVVILGTAAVAAFGTVLSTTHRSEVVTSADTTSVDTLEVHLSAGRLRIEFADVSQPQIEAQTSVGSGPWTMRVNGTTLVVRSPDSNFAWRGLFGPSDQATLRLPTAMQGMDASLRVAAGDLSANGRFGALKLDLQAGSASINGTATDLVSKTSAGTGALDLSGVTTADIAVTAGTMDAVLRGDQPSSTKVQVDAGALTLSLPQGQYDVTSDVSAGHLDNRLGTHSGADSTVDVHVSAGQVTLQPTD